MQTSLHIYSLAEELREKINGAIFIGTEFYKKEREAYLFFKAPKGVWALGMVYHPVSHGCFLIPRSKVRLKTNEKPWPFFQDAYETTVSDIRQLGFDRLIEISLMGIDQDYSIIMEAIGPNGNFWLIDNERFIKATLRNREYDPELPYSPPEPIERLNPFELEYYRLLEIFRGSDQFAENCIKKNIGGLDDILIDEVIERAGLEPRMSVTELDDDQIRSLHGQIQQVARMFGDYDRGYFYQSGKGNLAYPFKIKSLDEEAVKCKSLSFAVLESIRTKRVERQEVSRKQQVLDAIARQVKRIKRKIGKIEEDLKSARDYEKYKKYGELIQINLNEIKKGQDVIELPDAFIPDQKVNIKLDPTLTPAQNAEVYFKKFRKGRDALKLLERRLVNAQAEFESMVMMQVDFDAHFENASDKYDAEIEELLPKSGDRKIPTVRLPFREHVISTGVKIFIGRDGSDNDLTTFRHAKPYELWFHASQCPGSHVVMKFPSKTFEPSKAEIEETAQAAAYHSKARNSARVPVIFTQKKYVRKPRNAKPGLVTVEREKMVMVEPVKPE